MKKPSSLALTTAVIPAKAGIQSRRGYRIAGQPRKTIKQEVKYKSKATGFRHAPE
ncbi:MAG: hypothetical protein OXG62_15485 [Nitrospinae bacterium]|nr:hypothetical protein [Nitrospinota bacterium]